MVTTNFGRSGLAIVGFSGGPVAKFVGIGIGSHADVATLGSLASESLLERKNYSSLDMSAVNKATWTHDWNNVEMSGIKLMEFGIAPGSTIDIQDLWLRDAFGSIIFDGTNELQTEIELEVF